VLAWLVALALRLAAAQADTVVVCHATASAVQPYARLELPADQALGHRTHPDDLFDPPKGGCPEVRWTPTPSRTPTPTRTPSPTPTPGPPGAPAAPTPTRLGFPNTGGGP
jgi:hypothetical protein